MLRLVTKSGRGEIWQFRRLLSSGKVLESSKEFQERTAREIRFYKRMGLGGIVLMISSTCLAIYASQKRKEVLEKDRKEKNSSLEN
jgi:hypothetical protein